MNTRSGWLWWVVAAVVVAALVVVPLVVSDDDTGAEGFDGYVQSGTCASPSDEFVTDLEGADDAHAVEPYVAVNEGKQVTIGQYGAPEVPGFSVASIYSNQQFSMVITDPDSTDAVACGDILRPDADQYGDAGLAVVQLLPVGSSSVQGVATIERTQLQRELDITPTRARIVLSTEDVTVPAEGAAGYDSYVQSGPCASPADDLRADSESEDDYDVTPFRALSAETDEPVTVAYYGGPGTPGFGLGAAYTEQEFSVVLTDPASDRPVACGDILKPDDDKFTEAGLALVQLLPAGDAGVQGYAVVSRAAMQRELDVTPTQTRMFLFAPPASGA